ncbi:1229_t:CDS:1, partial [Funneliformis caledonium]
MSLSNDEFNSSESEEFVNEIKLQIISEKPSAKTFEELGLNSWLVDALKAMSINFPSEIQKA